MNLAAAAQPWVEALDGPKWALRGRVVTMNASNEVISDGIVFMDQSQIVAVQDASQPAPPAYDTIRAVSARGTIYPGLIELHNHLCYNALPLWNVPRLFHNRDEWQRNTDYKSAVGKPMRVLGASAELVHALIRYVEVKCMLGGVTASQGITLASFKGNIKRFFRGIVRNVEQTGETVLPGAYAHIADVHSGEAAASLKQQKRIKCYLLHLSEGTDGAARQHFLDLRLPDGSWAIADSLCGIHATALTGEDFAVLEKVGAKMVWSPFSNLLLYGNTADIRAAKAHGVPIGLGPDWSPSGSKNLLWEMKVARAWSATAEGGPILSDREIVAMVTRDAARILNWNATVGSIEAGKRADLLVIGRRDGDPYSDLLEATEKDVGLVVINGFPRFGYPSALRSVNGEDGLQSIKIGGRDRALYLLQAAADPDVASVSFNDARDILTEALGNLGAVAARVAKGLREAAPPELAAAVEARDEDIWLLAGEELQQMGITDGAVESPAAAAHSLTTHIAGDESYELDPLTVDDDATWVDRIKGQTNLPDALKEALIKMA
ncbi:MAG: amidohydrolase [Proteobacteria bacterium]|nr:MAG: amidohydrolase [Pseudomonadota bacterium]